MHNYYDKYMFYVIFVKIYQSLRSKWQRVMARMSGNESNGFKFTIRYPTSRVECCIPQASTSKVCHNIKNKYHISSVKIQHLALIN